MTLFFLIEGSLLASPIVGLLLALACNKRPFLKPWLYRIAGILAAISLVIALSPLSFSGILADAFVLMTAYAVYSATVFSMILSRRPKLAIFGFGLGFPIALGYVLATFGVMLVKVIAAEVEPDRRISVGSNHECRLVSDYAGYSIHVVYRPVLAPFFEWELAEKQLQKPDGDTDPVSCLAPEDAANGTKVIIEVRLFDGTIERTNVPR